MGPKQGIPTLAAARLQRWALILAAYSYDIEFRPTGQHGNADGLSRLPLKEVTSEGASSAPTIFNIGQLESLPVTAKQLQAATCTDSILSKVRRFMKEGWPKKIDKSLRAFEGRRQELTVEHGCVLWGIRVIVPSKLRKPILDELHRDHPGISRMKAVARGYVWWPGLDQDIQELVKGCQACQAVKHAPAVAPMHPWEWPPKPWQRVHLDFAGPLQGHTFLVAVDAHSKWPEVEIMTSTTASKTIDVLRRMFAAHGLPEQIVSDNGPQFVSEEFAAFMRANKIYISELHHIIPQVTDWQRDSFSLLRPLLTQVFLVACLYRIDSRTSCSRTEVLHTLLPGFLPVHCLCIDRSGHVWTCYARIKEPVWWRNKLSRRLTMTGEHNFESSSWVRV